MSPAEPAVFVLHQAFAYPYTEIADMLGRTPEAIRQVAHRAREHVTAQRPRYRVTARVQQKATERFIEATLGGDLEALLDVLAPDVTLWTDGGGKGPATSLLPVHGRDTVADLLITVALNVPADATVAYRNINGDLSAVLFTAGSPFAVLILDLDGPTSPASTPSPTPTNSPESDKTGSAGRRVGLLSAKTQAFAARPPRL
ncbi:sigma factor-like helix-turn-helix DNA-binding protein [Kribbella sp. NPDC050470]|uniref:sigma factor-like helix-turn-helix DNA-binding protein n=1 Tax=unclassified Kribbella TaxID=2644121 RepID=UPI003797B39F